MAATLEAIAEHIEKGEFEKAEKALASSRSTAENEVEILFLRGYLQERRHERVGAFETYQGVLARDPDHTESLFRSALLCDLVGDDDAAIELYERCVASQPAHVNALLNLSVLHEEAGCLGDAEANLKSVLDEYPNHFRAHSFFKSVQSAYTMVYDERTQRESEQRNAILDVPVTDFELSVRSRNCLKQMNIQTIGDLLRVTESELLSYKNFGETSLSEIKAMLAQKGLRLGQSLQRAAEAPRPAVTTAAAVNNDLSIFMNKPVSELELSVRSRKCLQRLGIATVGELAMRSEPDLMSIKNFGQTSLNEIKRQLALYGLTLRTSR